MLAPHHAEDAKFGERRLASAEQVLDLFVLVGSKAVLPEGLRREGRSHGSGHGEVLLSHLAGRLGRAILALSGRLQPGLVLGTSRRQRPRRRFRLGDRTNLW